MKYKLKKNNNNNNMCSKEGYIIKVVLQNKQKEMY